MKKVFSIALGLLVFSNCLIAQSDAYKNKKEKQETATDDKSVKIVFARELVKEFQENYTTAKEKYINKEVKLNGILERISELNNGATFIYIKSDYPFSEVNCMIKGNQAIDLKPDDSVSIQGTVVGFLSDVILIDARVSKVNESERIISAVDIVKEYQANEDASNKKYLNKAVEVTGELLEAQKNEVGNPVLSIKGVDAFSGVSCTLKGTTPVELKAGTTVTVKGVVTGFLSDVTIIEAIITKP